MNTFIRRVLNAWGWYAWYAREFGSILFRKRLQRICLAILCHSLCGCWRTGCWRRRVIYSPIKRLLWKARKVVSFLAASQQSTFKYYRWQAIFRLVSLIRDVKLQPVYQNGEIFVWYCKTYFDGLKDGWMMKSDIEQNILSYSIFSLKTPVLENLIVSNCIVSNY